MRYARFVTGLVAFTVSTLVVSLVVIASLLPVVTDWSRVVLTSGSMAPSIAPGDVVLADPDIDHPVGPGTVLVFDDPNRDGLVTHRVVETVDRRTYRTQGDANADADTALVTRGMVAGQGRVVVPMVGLPSAWIHQGAPHLAVLAVLLLLALLWLSRFAVLDRHDPWLTAHAPRHLAAPRPSRAAAAVGVALLLVAAGVLAPQVARSAFAATTSNGQAQPNALTTGLEQYLASHASGNTYSFPFLPLLARQPTRTTLPNYDVNRDSAPGLLIAKGSGLDETDWSKVQRWNLVTASDEELTLVGRARVRLWSAMKNFNRTKRGAVAVGLYECNLDHGCTTLATRTLSTTGSWSGNRTTWVSKEWDLGQVSATVPPRATLELRVAVLGNSGDDMMFAYDTTSYPSVLTID